MLSSLKYAVRSPAKTPWLTAVVVITLALGLTGLVASQLRGVSATDPLTFVARVMPALCGRSGGERYPGAARDESRSADRVAAE
jgi:hypothetical protein